MDILTYIMAKNKAATMIDNAISGLGKGIIYRGAVSYYNDLPKNAEIGDCYTIIYKDNNDEANGAEYVWGLYNGTNQWIQLGPDLSGYQEALVSGTNIKTINGNSVLGSGNIAFTIPTKTSDLINDSGFVVNTNIDATGCIAFSSPSAFTLNVNDNTKHWEGILEYSTDKNTWNIWDGTTTLSSVGNVLYLRGTGNTRISGTQSTGSSVYGWTLTGSNISCIGNIENLLDYQTVINGNHPKMNNRCFQNLFYHNSSLISAPELPATTLAENCYNNMFIYCTSLIIPPELPATILAKKCYAGMFSNCSSLQYAPVFKATVLAPPDDFGIGCCEYMFQNCISLISAPTLPATSLTPYCYQYMFVGCTSLTIPPALPAMILAERCYYYMFSGCTALTHLPALPALNFASSCYASMFQNCSSIKLSETQTSLYTVPYRIPSTGIGANQSQPVQNMFNSTGGTWTGSPRTNTTYYSQNAIIYPDGHIVNLDGTISWSTNIKFDQVPTQGSNNAVTSNGIYSAIEQNIVANPSPAGTSTLTGLQIGENKYLIPTGTTIIANPSSAGSTPLTGLQIGNNKYVIQSGTTVVANPPSYFGSNILNTIGINSINYKIGGGTTVIANPSNPGTNPLNSIQIGTDKYIIQGGGGGAAEVKAGDSTYISMLQLKNYITNLYYDKIWGSNGDGITYYPTTLNGIQGTFFSTYNPNSDTPVNFTLTLADIVNQFPSDDTSYAIILGALVINASTPIVAPLYVVVEKNSGGGGSGSGSGSGSEIYTLSLCFNDDLLAEDFYTITPEGLSSDMSIATALESVHANDVDNSYSISCELITELYDIVSNQNSRGLLGTAALQCYMLVGYYRSSESNVSSPSSWEPLTSVNNMNLCTFNQFFTKFCGFPALDTFIYGSVEQ